MGNTRKFTVKLLTKMDDDQSYSNILLDKALANSDFDARDKKFVSAMFYGVIERKLTLDEIIASLCKNPHQKINHTVRNILRTAIYQLLYMDSVPDNAAVDEAVELSKKCRNPAISGFVNGLLREFIRGGKKLPERKDELERLSLEYSCPLWLVQKWDKEYGRDICETMLKTSLGRAPVTVRLNSARFDTNETLDKLISEGMTFEKSRFLRDALNVVCPGAIENTGAFRQGRFHVQDLSSQMCCQAVSPKAGDTVLDLCSAPGGKAFTMAEMMQNSGKLMAFDLHENKVKLIRSGAKRLGLECVSAEVNNAKVFNESLPQADKVLVDAPCSGLGVIRRKPEIKYKKPEDFDRLPEVQYEILDTASRYVKLGGTLVYSTCTVSRAENDEVADKFLSLHDDFEPCAVGEAFGWLAGETRVTITPDIFDSDGFFIAKFIRRR